MQPIATSAGAGHRVLAEILGAQIAWWNLGYTIRRQVVRDARRGKLFPDPDVWAVAVGWAWQRLAAPRWWRLVRGAGGTVLLITSLTGLVAVLGEVDGTVALSGAVTGCLPLTAGWSWRQSRTARMLVEQAAGQRHGPVPSRGLLARAAVVLIVVGAALSAMIIAIANERAARYDCPRFVVDAPVHDWWVSKGGRAGVGCPAGASRSDPSGVRYTPWVSDRGQPNYVLYDPLAADPLAMPLAIFTAWTAAGGPSGVLGEPVGGGTDRMTAFTNFAGGVIIVGTGRAPETHLGERYSVAREPGDPCVAHDRPCIVTAYIDAEGIHVRWQYGLADAFNVGWKPEGGPPDSARGREVAGYELTMPVEWPMTTYFVGVQACDKHFLSRSGCTPGDEVIVRVG